MSCAEARKPSGSLKPMWVWASNHSVPAASTDAWRRYSSTMLDSNSSTPGIAQAGYPPALHAGADAGESRA